MHAHCPDCETELDQAHGICPACGWDPILSSIGSEHQEWAVSPSDSDRAKDLEAGWALAATKSAPVSRTRATVIAGLLAMVAGYGVLFTFLGST